MVNFPTSADVLSNPTSSTMRNDPGFELDVVISTLNDIVEAIEGYLLNGTAYKRISAGVLASPAASFDFTSIPSSYRSLHIILVARGTTAATAQSVVLRLNNDSAANYDTQAMYASATTPASFELLAQTSIQVGTVPASTATATVAGHLLIDLPLYASSTFQKTVEAQGAHKVGTATGNLTTRKTSGFWRSTATITQVTLSPAADNFDTGSFAVLYGVPS